MAEAVDPSFVVSRRQSQLSPLRFRTPVIFAIICCFAICVDGHSLYTDSWAVEINGGRRIADKIAKKHGFINAGEVRTTCCARAVLSC